MIIESDLAFCAKIIKKSCFGQNPIYTLGKSAEENQTELAYKRRYLDMCCRFDLRNCFIPDSNTEQLGAKHDESSLLKRGIRYIHDGCAGNNIG